MRRILVLCFAACGLLSAQRVVPSFQLTPEESAKAKQLTEDLKNAEMRSKTAEAAWDGFFSNFRAAHPELQGIAFTSDFRYAFARVNSRTVSGLVEAAAVELPTQERQKAESLYRERNDSQQALEQARRNLFEFTRQVVVSHVPAENQGRWSNGVIFTQDYRLALPN